MNEGSDYINGNYICLPGESNEKYIACQAPLPNTFVDFYRAVWENKSPVICMVTKQIEGCTQKAHCYWPSLEGETIQIDDFFITVETFEDLSNIEVRTLTIQFQEEKRTVVHLLYTEWPDFGVPKTTQKIRELVNLLQKIQKIGQQTQLNGPPVIHCSAGIGRTGALICILFCLEKLRNGVPPQDLKIVDIVVSMRKQRAGMIQTAAQYRFVYSVLADWVRFSGTAIPPFKVRRLDLAQSGDDFEQIPRTESELKAPEVTETMKEIEIKPMITAINLPMPVPVQETIAPEIVLERSSSVSKMKESTCDSKEFKRPVNTTPINLRKSQLIRAQ